jgi:polar amino acid transport system substrate-binding protein
VSSSKLTRAAFLRTATGAVVMSGGAAAFLAGCGDDDDGGGEGGGASGGGSQSTLGKARAAGTISVGFANDPPWSMQEPSGDVVGIGPALAGEIFPKLGIDKIDNTLQEFDALIPALQAGRFDAIVAQAFITPERCAQVIFSNPTICVFEAYVVKPGNPTGVKTLKELGDNDDIKIGLLAGTSEIDHVKAAGVPEGNVVTFKDTATAIEGVAAGRADVFLYDQVALQYLVQQSDANVELTPPFLIDNKPAGCTGFAFKKEDTALRDAFNKELEAMMSSGQAADLIKPYVSDVSEGMKKAQETAAEELCAG